MWVGEGGVTGMNHSAWLFYLVGRKRVFGKFLESFQLLFQLSVLIEQCLSEVCSKVQFCVCACVCMCVWCACVCVVCMCVVVHESS